MANIFAWIGISLQGVAVALVVVYAIIGLINIKKAENEFHLTHRIIETKKPPIILTRIAYILCFAGGIMAIISFLI